MCVFRYFLLYMYTSKYGHLLISSLISFFVGITLANYVAWDITGFLLLDTCEKFLPTSQVGHFRSQYESVINVEYLTIYQKSLHSSPVCKLASIRSHSDVPSAWLLPLFGKDSVKRVKLVPCGRKIFICKRMPEKKFGYHWPEQIL